MAVVAALIARPMLTGSSTLVHQLQINTAPSPPLPPVDVPDVVPLPPPPPPQPMPPLPPDDPFNPAAPAVPLLPVIAYGFLCGAHPLLLPPDPPVT